MSLASELSMPNGVDATVEAKQLSSLDPAAYELRRQAGIEKLGA
jgi:hypothetical protein